MRRLLLLLLCLALVGCGDSIKDEQTIDADANAITAAAERTTEQGTARVTVAGDLEVSGVTGTQTGEGVTDFDNGSSYVKTTVKIADQSFAGEAIILDSAMYLKLPAEISGLPEGKEWSKVDLDEALGGGEAFSSATSADPAQYLKLLQGSGDIKTAGTQSIGGRRTTHYTATINYAELAKSGPENVRDLAKQSLRFSATPTVPTEVWVDDSGLIRRQRIAIETKSIGASPAQKQDITIDYEEYGVDVEVNRPPDDIVLDVTEQVKDQLDG
jgi:hypothetical protein